MTSSQTDPRPSVSDMLTLIEIKPGVRFSRGVLKQLLPDIETALFFGKVYQLTAQQLSTVLMVVVGDSDVLRALVAEGGTHSNDLQDYIIGDYDEDGVWHDGIIEPAHKGEVNFSPDVPHGEILPHVWASLEVEVAASIQQVAAKLEGVVDRLPGKQGEMVFRSMMVMNSKRPTIGDHRAQIHHARQKENLLILDVSGSMSSGTVRRIIDDVVALSYKANAHMAIVSDSCFYWEPGTFGTDEILAKAQYGGTHYEKLKPLFDRDWGVVITVADYDSARAAAQKLATCKGHVDQVLDISLVNRPTYLAECVGQLADEVKPLLIGSSSYVLR